MLHLSLEAWQVWISERCFQLLWALICQWAACTLLMPVDAFWLAIDEPCAVKSLYRKGKSRRCLPPIPLGHGSQQILAPKQLFQTQNSSFKLRTALSNSGFKRLLTNLTLNCWVREPWPKHSTCHMPSDVWRPTSHCWRTWHVRHRTVKRPTSHCWRTWQRPTAHRRRSRLSSLA